MKQQKKHSFLPLVGVIGVLLGFLILGSLVMLQLGGAQIQETSKTAYLPDDVLAQSLPEQETECLLLTTNQGKHNGDVLSLFHQVLSDMRVGYDTIDVSTLDAEQLVNYKTVVVTFGELDDVSEQDLLQTLFDWVEAGGRLFFTQTFQTDTTLDTVYHQLGIADYTGDTLMANQLYFSPDFMAAGGSFAMEDPYDSSLEVTLFSDCQIYAWLDNTQKNPILWSLDSGNGRIVVANWGYCEKSWRGMYASAYSLLEDCFVYPVINASSIYLDDFPSPVPDGYDSVIKAAYGVNTKTFYTDIWWPTLRQLSQQYGLKYTATIIETYEDDVNDAPVRSVDRGLYKLYGSEVLSMGGELGIHGYNHQPLCMDGYDMKDLPYNLWPSSERMSEDFGEVIDLFETLFPNVNCNVYVPPSNILSEEGRAMLASDYPQIKTIASMYFPEEDDPGYAQEFGIGADGIVNAPRITSDCKPSDYMKLAILSELNYHMVNAHFIHPDDLLDVDRGRNLGWETMKDCFSSYLDWIYTAIPMIRNTTASEEAGAIQRYSHLAVKRTMNQNTLHLELDGLYDSAYLMVRCSYGTPTDVTGGTLEQVAGNLYLLCATDSDVTITCEEA